MGRGGATADTDRTGQRVKKSARRVPLRHRLVRVLHVPQSAFTRAPASRRGVPTRPLRRQDEAHDDFEQFFRTNYAPVVRLAYSLAGSLPVAEELAQEAFVAAHRRWRRVVGFDRPDLWVRRVVINRAISFRRRAVVERRAMQRVRGTRTASIEIELADEELWQALRELSPRQAQVLALVYVEDQPISEVARILDLGDETVRTHLKRGRQALARRLAPDPSPTPAPREVL